MNDLIDRQAAIDALDRIGSLDTEADKKYARSVFEALPSAQPERKTGRWIDDNCSECGQYVYHGDVRNFCPNCGADMREPEDIPMEYFESGGK